MSIAIGAAAAVAVAVIYFLCFRKRSIPADKIFENQLVVDRLDAADIKSWFVSKNPEKKYTAIVMEMTEENLNKYHLKISSRNQGGNVLIQCLFDPHKDSIAAGRIIMYNSISDNIAGVLRQSGGIVIFD